MCIRDRDSSHSRWQEALFRDEPAIRKARQASGVGRRRHGRACLLYTSDAADERSSVDLGGRRIIKKKNTQDTSGTIITEQLAQGDI